MEFFGDAERAQMKPLPRLPGTRKGYHYIFRRWCPFHLSIMYGIVELESGIRKCLPLSLSYYTRRVYDASRNVVVPLAGTRGWDEADCPPFIHLLRGVI